MMSNTVDMMIANPQHPSMILFLMHAPVLTVGKGMSAHDTEAMKADKGSIVNIDRGGKITYHGPGQLVCYPLLRLSDFNIKPGDYVPFLHAWIVRSLESLCFTLHETNDHTGVWIKNHNENIVKAGFIGVSMHRGVTKHGFALNLNTDLDAFSAFPVCSMGHTKMIGNIEIEVDTVINALLSNLQLQSTILHADSKQYLSKSFFYIE
jgi:lipoyl(octanoyl) transferase